MLGVTPALDTVSGSFKDMSISFLPRSRGWGGDELQPPLASVAGGVAGFCSLFPAENRREKLEAYLEDDKTNSL